MHAVSGAISWPMSGTMTVQLVIDALMMAQPGLASYVAISRPMSPPNGRIDTVISSYNSWYDIGYFLPPHPGEGDSTGSICCALVRPNAA